jgi:hypothetical protein
VFLELLSTPSNCFQYLEEVCKAHIGRFPFDGTDGRPEKVLKEIIASKTTHFLAVFAEFSLRLGIYGFGDLKVQAMYDQVKQKSENKN